MSNPFNPEPIRKFAAILNEAPRHIRLARAILSFFSRNLGIGYGLVPMAWASWSIKTANCEEYLAKLSPSLSYGAGFHAGRAEAYRRVAAEIAALQKSA